MRALPCWFGSSWYHEPNITRNRNVHPIDVETERWMDICKFSVSQCCKQHRDAYQTSTNDQIHHSAFGNKTHKKSSIFRSLLSQKGTSILTSCHIRIQFANIFGSNNVSSRDARFLRHLQPICNWVLIKWGQKTNFD